METNCGSDACPCGPLCQTHPTARAAEPLAANAPVLDRGQPGALDANHSEATMSRVQLSINVTDLDAAVVFYTKLFHVAPAKLRPAYANFIVADPPLKLVLNSPGNGSGGTINHLGVEMTSAREVEAASARIAGDGLVPIPEPTATCCYALQDKVWVHDPDRVPWEFYTVLDHIETP